MTYKYGEFTENQIGQTKERMRKQIFFLLLCVDPQTKENYKNVNVDQAFDSLMREFAAFNNLLLCPKEMVSVMTLLEAARNNYKEQFDWSVYRKLILDAGNMVLKIKEV